MTTSSIKINVQSRWDPPPIALCKDVKVPTDPGTCSTASAFIDDGSSDPDGDALTLTQSPLGPYTLGPSNVTLVASEAGGASALWQGCSRLLQIMRSAQLCEVTGPNAALRLHISGLGLRNKYRGSLPTRYWRPLPGTSRRRSFRATPTAWLRTVERAARFLHPPVVLTSSFGARPILRSARLCKAATPN